MNPAGKGQAPPYKSQPPLAYWEAAVSRRHPLELSDIYSKKFEVAGKRLATAGSCFAQHIGRALKARGYSFLDEEPAPEIFPAALHSAYGYGLYSARYGNIYTVRQLLQLLRRSLGEFTPAENHWSKGDGYVDPFRPTIEPQPYVSVEEVAEQRARHLESVRRVFERCEVFIFTMGLTEAWEHAADGAAYPVVPGTRAGGTFDAAKYRFHNFNYPEIMADLESFHSRLREINPEVRLMLTVSPVPLVATATAGHVLAATMYSKSVLRAVAGDFAAGHPSVDYFPSYEIIASPAARGLFFMADGRTVSRAGVEYVMSHFFQAHGRAGEEPHASPAGAAPKTPDCLADQLAAMDALCDEYLLNELQAGKDD
jgi:hypothetical protein